MNIKDLIAEVRAHDAGATPGPWEYDGSRCVYVPEEFRYPDADSALFCGHWKPNAALIAHYRTAAPLLADEVESLNAANEELLLTLYAEQGLNKGAPSPVWRHQGQGTWHNVNTGSVVQRGGWPVTMPGESTWTRPNGTHGTAENARAAMKAADAA